MVAGFRRLELLFADRPVLPQHRLKRRIVLAATAVLAIAGARLACAPRAIGVETGGCNIQFGVDPRDGRMVVIEMNPRVSRSSALASKATGFPIAKIAAKLAVGWRLHELGNDITLGEGR